jgi:hypothetical protein
MKPEIYWAIRIGNPRKHYTYLMLSEDGATPALFVSKKIALQSRPPQLDKDHAVVRVRLTVEKGQP